MKKAQMFILATVFLAGLVFSVQQLLGKYIFLNEPTMFEKHDFYLAKNIHQLFNDSMTTSSDCDDALSNIKQLDSLLKKSSPIKGFSIELSSNGFYQPNIFCSNYYNSYPSDPPLKVMVRLKSSNSDTKESYDLYAY